MSQQKIKLASASFIGISSIVGSGWLFAPYVAAHISGPAAILSWTIGTLIIYLLAMCYAEIATLHPIRGLSAVITTLSHNQYFGFPFAIANWLGIVAVIALEADATVQYLVNIVPSWHHLFFDATESMTLIGSLLALVFVIFYTLVNFWGIKLLAKANNLITVIKLAVPVITVIILLCAAFHPHNFTSAGGSFMPYGFTSVIVTILTAGIIVSFNGFQTILSFSSEIHNPTRTIPWALTIAIFVSFILYIVLQVAFIGALPPSFLAHGWDSFNMSAPIVQLVGILGLNFLLLCYISVRLLHQWAPRLHLLGQHQECLQQWRAKNRCHNFLIMFIQSMVYQDVHLFSMPYWQWFSYLVLIVGLISRKCLAYFISFLIKPCHWR